MATDAFPVLDPFQLKRIQAMHRGFLYQHLYAVGAILLAGASGLKVLRVERDEDIEIELPNLKLYVQTKTRNRKLHSADVADAVARFEAIRKAHSDGTRTLTPNLWLVSNADPTEQFRNAMAAWPPDIFFRSPNLALGKTDALPPAWPALSDALAWCLQRAAEVPFGSLQADTLVWKLSGIVLLACTGDGPKELKAADLPVLLEQLVVQLHSFPNSPRIYRPQEDEPLFDGPEKARLIVGFSGAGKTAWAAEGSLHSGRPVAYFDVGDMPTAAVAPALARELAAVLMHDKRDEIRRIMLPGSSGLQSLRGIDQFVQDSGVSFIAVLDNVHRMDANELTNIVRVAPGIHWILLAQPWPDRPLLEANLTITAIPLRGWSVVEIAGEFLTNDCELTATQAEEIRHLTGGLPLYVQSAARIVRDYYKSNVESFLTQMRALTHAHVTGQEAILGQVQAHLGDSAKRAASLLVIADIPLKPHEAISLVRRGGNESESVAAASLRELAAWGVIETLRDGRLVMHDAYRILAQKDQQSLPPDVLLDAKKHLVHILMLGHGVDRFRLLCRLLPEVGETETLVDVASGASEYFHEFGMSQEFDAILRAAIDSPDLSPSDKFWALDTIIFLGLQNGDIAAAAANLARVEEHMALFEPSERQFQAVAMKRMLIAGRSGKRRVVEEEFRRGSALSPTDNEFQRILRYNYATCLFHLKDYEKAADLAFELAMEYFDVLGLRSRDVFARNIPEIVPKLKKSPTESDDVKHLADALDLHASALQRAGRDPRKAVLQRMTAFKFYVITNALTSAVRVGKDVVDGLIEFGDADAARHFMESTLLPLLAEGKLLDEFVPIHSLYAVVLAYCGEHDAARKTMHELSSFLIASPQYRWEFQNQQRLIGLIIDGVVRLPSLTLPTLPADVKPAARLKIGRNEPCPCGSGRKYKKCCGA